MKNILVIARKELGTYLGSPMAYIVTAVFLALTGTFFTTYLAGVGYGDTSIRGFVNAARFLVLLFAAVLTMRLVSEEKKVGTWELLVTVPVRDCRDRGAQVPGGVACSPAAGADPVLPDLLSVVPATGHRTDGDHYLAVPLGGACLAAGGSRRRSPPTDWRPRWWPAGMLSVAVVPAASWAGSLRARWRRAGPVLAATLLSPTRSAASWTPARGLLRDSRFVPVPLVAPSKWGWRRVLSCSQIIGLATLAVAWIPRFVIPVDPRHHHIS